MVHRGALALALILSLLGGPVSASGLGTPDPSPRGTRPPAGVALPYPDGCAAYDLSTQRCDYIVSWARERAGVAPTDPFDVQLLGDPECPDGSVDCTVPRTKSFVVRVRLTAPDGVSSDQSVFCGIGGGSTLLCTDAPVIARHGPTMDDSGYRDRPCSGEAPDAPCASPVPSADPDAAAAAQPLEVALVRIPVDQAGGYSIPLGEAILPNGILTEATFGLRDDSPTDLLVSPDGVTLRLESLDGGPPFENVYEHGWRPGTERVRATLSFMVESFEPGAVLEVTNVLVR